MFSGAKVVQAILEIVKHCPQLTDVTSLAGNTV